MPFLSLRDVQLVPRKRGGMEYCLCHRMQFVQFKGMEEKIVAKQHQKSSVSISYIRRCS